VNYLAHAFLSSNTDEMLGNIIADSVKGNKYLLFPESISQGIVLHRKIDFFADIHPIFRESKARINPSLRRYSGIIIDIFYDHFLASRWTDYSDATLTEFSQEVYRVLYANYEILPEKFKSFLPRMVQYDYLYNYAFADGLERALRQFSHRYHLPSFEPAR
jgi:acyl carrier protein phosphodiesterase